MTKAAAETSKRGGSKLEGRKINLPRAEKQQHLETTASVIRQPEKEQLQVALRISK